MWKLRFFVKFQIKMTRWQHSPFSLALITSGIGSPSLFWLVTSSSVFNILFIFNPKNNFWNAILQFKIIWRSILVYTVSSKSVLATRWHQRPETDTYISINKIDLKSTSILRLSSPKKYWQYVIKHPLWQKGEKR